MNKEISPMDKAVLSELQKKKRDILMQLGSIEEMKFQVSEDLKSINSKIIDFDNKIRKEFNIEEGNMWRITPDNKIEQISQQQMAENFNM